MWVRRDNGSVGQYNANFTSYTFDSLYCPRIECIEIRLITCPRVCKIEMCKLTTGSA